MLKQVDKNDNFLANYSWATRKDYRNAVGAARKAQTAWAKRTALNRSLILYRIAEMLEDRREVFESRLLQVQKMTKARAAAQVDEAIDCAFYYAGWADKFGSVLSSVNPVAAPFFNFTVPEPVGVVTVLAPKKDSLLGLMQSFLPAICSGNTVVMIVENDAPTLAIDLAEVIATSDVPKGVINILTGRRDELLKFVAGHMDVNSILAFDASQEEKVILSQGGADSVKRVFFSDLKKGGSLREVERFLEMKTAWHPVGT